MKYAEYAALTPAEKRKHQRDAVKKYRDSRKKMPDPTTDPQAFAKRMGWTK